MQEIAEPDNSEKHSRRERAELVAEHIRECDGVANVEIQDTYVPPRVHVEVDGGIGIPDDVSELLDAFGMTLVPSETFYDDGINFVAEVVEHPRYITRREVRNLGTSVGIALPPDALDRADIEAYDEVMISARDGQIILTRSESPADEEGDD